MQDRHRLNLEASNNPQVFGNLSAGSHGSNQMVRKACKEFLISRGFRCGADAVNLHHQHRCFISDSLCSQVHSVWHFAPCTAAFSQVQDHNFNGARPYNLNRHLTIYFKLKLLPYSRVSQTGEAALIWTQFHTSSSGLALVLVSQPVASSVFLLFQVGVPFLDFVCKKSDFQLFCCQVQLDNFQVAHLNISFGKVSL